MCCKGHVSKQRKSVYNNKNIGAALSVQFTEDIPMAQRKTALTPVC